MEAIKVIILIVILGIAVYLKQRAEAQGSGDLPQKCNVSSLGNFPANLYHGWIYRKATDSMFCLESNEPGYWQAPSVRADADKTFINETVFFMEIFSDRTPPEEIKMHNRYE